ncbi:hypothetical protein BB560_001269 [Smittium megazygosporum]|uniref:Peptide hydrolase n=1 Tax=Smittium megazygosporum TaxID=133381 RepID=A0A2T9ZI23_9FUNG|nr:hypothetical protein BB560_001269 [Smittium megazygosporum]
MFTKFKYSRLNQDTETLKLVPSAPTLNRRSRFRLFIYLFIAFIFFYHNPFNSSKSQRKRKVKTKDIFKHLDSFYSIALAHDNSRSTINGYPQVAKYVISKLEKHDVCTPKIQKFKVPLWAELGPPTLELVSGSEKIHFIPNTDFGYHRYGGSSASLNEKDFLFLKNGGCYISDDLVLISTPPTAKKPSAARVRIVDWKEGDPLVSIPVLSITHSTFQTIKHSKESKLNMIVDSRIDVVETFNVLCEGKYGNRNNTIVVGSHLDSVAFGPGINDNGSGAASTLAIAIHFSKNHYRPKNRLVFAWWGSEEDGLLGSRHFVRDLVEKDEARNIKSQKSDQEIDISYKEIAMNLNFDMLASPNYIPFIHNGTDAPNNARCGSERIQHIFQKYFMHIKKNYKITDMIGGSDFLPFILNSIPSGGLLTGASEIKTEEERLLFGGMANAPLDPCYHKYCDTIKNINKDALKLMSNGALYSILHFSNSEDLRADLQKC